MSLCVQHTPEVQTRVDGPVFYWLFPDEFSQSRFGGREIGSNACTLITLLMSSYIQSLKISVRSSLGEPLNRIFVAALAESIIEGNEIYDNLVSDGKLAHSFLDITDALGLVQKKCPGLQEWPLMASKGVSHSKLLLPCNYSRENIIREPLGLSLCKNLRELLFNWVYNPPVDKIPHSDLFITLIANSRTILFVYHPTDNLGSVCLIDSHDHSKIMGSGAVVAQSSLSLLHFLCQWCVSMSDYCFGVGPDIVEYELSCIYMRNPDIVKPPIEATTDNLSNSTQNPYQF